MKHLRMIRLLRNVAILPLFFLFCAANAQVQTAKNVSMIPNSGGFYEYLPQGYNTSGQTYPLILFIHGIGELGNGTTELPRVLQNGPPRLISQGTFPNSFTVNGQTSSFIVISPQFMGWPSADDVDGILNYLTSRYRVDTKRIYVTGLSMGGGVVWDYAGWNSSYASRVAAIAPVCGASGPNYTKTINIANSGMGVWAFHNSGDPTVTVQNTIQFVDMINSYLPAVPAKKTTPNIVSHDAWTNAYDPNYRENNTNVYEWMLTFKKGTAWVPANQYPSSNAGPDQSITLPNNSITLNGSGSDVDGTVSSYQWTKISGPSQGTINSSWQAQTTVSNLTTGTYTFRLTVTDDKGAATYDDVVVTQNALISYTTIPSKIEAENYASMNGVQNENTTDVGGGLDAGYIDNGDWMNFGVNATQAGTYTLNFRVASFTNGSQFLLKKEDGTLLTTVNVPNTGGYQTWQTVSATVNLPQGQQVLKLISSSYSNWNINWIDFTSSSNIPLPTPVGGATIHIEAENYSSMSGVQTENTSDAGGGLNVSYIDPSDWMDYSVNPATSGTYTINFRIASPSSNAQFQLKKADGTLLATVNASNTGGYQTWQTISTTVSLSQGQQTLRIVSTSPQWNPWNINWIDIISASTPSPTPVASTHIEAENYASMSGVQTENTADAGGGLNVSYIDPYDWMNYTVNAATAGSYTINLRVASPANNAQLQLKKGDGTLLTTVNIPNTGGYQTWQIVTATVTLAAGQQTLQVVSTSPQWNPWNFNWMDIALSAFGSSAASTQASTEANAAITSKAIDVFPNPVQDKFVLQVNNEFTGGVQVQIVDMLGSIQKQFSLTKAALGTSQFYLSIGSLAPGGYIIKATMNQWSNSKQIIKQ